MNFNQWKNFISKNKLPKVIYCCGDQPTLVELVIQDIRQALNVPVTDYFEMKSSDNLWEMASQYPLDILANRLTVVRNAETIQDWEPLYTWLAQTRNNPNNYLLFVSHQSDAPAIYNKGKRVSYEAHIEIIRSKGKFVKCSQPNDEDLLSWVQSFGLSKLSAEHLINRTSGDTTSIYDVLRKIRVWKGSPSSKALDLLCSEQALDSFADYLILRDKKIAYLAICNMPEDMKYSMIAKLDYRLDLLSVISKYVKQRMYAGDIAAKTGINVFLIKTFSGVIKDYDERKIKYCRQLLTMADGALRDGAKIGVWESLITLW